MSRVSQKSGLSPSITKGSNAIDLGKDSGVDMGRKSQPSITSGGIGVTQEVTNVGGMSVSAGANIDITPLDFGININPSEGTVSVATGAEIPGGILGVSGGITIDTNTGEVIGGSIGGEVGGLGINISNSKKGGLGIEFTVQILGPIELSLGFGFPPKESTPTPTPTPEPTLSRPGVGSKAEEVLPLLDAKCRYYIVYFGHGVAIRLTFEKPLIRISDHYYYKLGLWISQGTLLKQEALNNYYSPGYIEWHDYPTRGDRKGYHCNDTNFGLLQGFGSNSICSFEGDNVVISYYGGTSGYLFSVSGTEAKKYLENYVAGGDAWEFSIIKLSCEGSNDPPENITPIRQSSPSPSPSPPPFPNPPPRRQNKVDICCRENLKFLRAIYTGLGISKFPGKLPATIIQEISKEGETPAEPPQVPIADFVDLLDWQFRRDDERWGQWEIQIDVKDADLTEENDQGKQIKFPNLAESIAELEGQMLSVMANVDALVAITTKNLVESGMGRQEAIKAYLASKAIIKYMAFKSTEVDIPVPMTFTAGAETISALVQESEGHIKGTDYVEKETLRDILLDLLQAAAIIRAVHWQKIDSKKDTKTQLLNLLKGSVDLVGLVSNPKKSTDGEEKNFDPAQNFEDFIDSVEDGFRNTTGITDIQNPYGKTPERRPRIRQIGDNISQAGNDK